MPTVTIAHGPDRDPDAGYEAERVTATGDTYEAARDEAKAQVPTGHFVYSITRE